MASSRGAGFSGSRRLLCASGFFSTDKKVRLIGRLLSSSEVLSESSSVDTPHVALTARQRAVASVLFTCALFSFQSACARPAVCTAVANVAPCVFWWLPS